MQEIFCPTNLQQDICDILKNFQTMTQEQIEILFSRHGRDAGQVEKALHDLWVHGKVYHERDGKVWKSNQHATKDMERIACTHIMLACTEGAQDELTVYKTAVFGAGDFTIGFICEGFFYYIQYLLNDSSALTVRLLQERLNAQGDKDSREDVRLILAAPAKEIFDKVPELTYPTMYMLLERNGFDVKMTQL